MDERTRQLFKRNARRGSAAPRRLTWPHRSSPHPCAPRYSLPGETAIFQWVQLGAMVIRSGFDALVPHCETSRPGLHYIPGHTYSMTVCSWTLSSRNSPGGGGLTQFGWLGMAKNAKRGADTTNKSGKMARGCPPDEGLPQTPRPSVTRTTPLRAMDRWYFVHRKHSPKVGWLAGVTCVVSSPTNGHKGRGS